MDVGRCGRDRAFNIYIYICLAGLVKAEFSGLNIPALVKRPSLDVKSSDCNTDFQIEFIFV